MFVNLYDRLWLVCALVREKETDCGFMYLIFFIMCFCVCLNLKTYNTVLLNLSSSIIAADICRKSSLSCIQENMGENCHSTFFKF